MYLSTELKHCIFHFSTQRKKGCKKVTYQYNPRKKECKIENVCENVCKNVWKPPGMPTFYNKL